MCDTLADKLTSRQADKQTSINNWAVEFRPKGPEKLKIAIFHSK